MQFRCGDFSVSFQKGYKCTKHLYQFGSGFWWYHAIILPFICWLLDSFSHSYLDYMGYQDFHHCLKCRKTVEMHENDRGRDWDTGISLLKILAFVWRVTVYCYQPHLLPEHTWDWVLLPWRNESNGWMDGWMECDLVSKFSGPHTSHSYFPNVRFVYIWLPRKRFNKQPRRGFVERCRWKTICLFW